MNRVLFLAIFISYSAAASNILFGPEFNFSNENILRGSSGTLVVNSEQSEIARDRFMQKVLEKCQPDNCKITEYFNRYDVLSYRVTFKDGWFFQIETDPDVVEIQTKPTSLADNVKLHERYERYIFDTANEIGLVRGNHLRDWMDWAAGHIHVGIKEAFEGDVKLFRNFIVDYTNHIELAHHFFANDENFAPSITRLSAEQKANFVSLVGDVDKGKITTIEDFAKRLESEVYYKNPHGHQAEKHQALNVMRITNDSLLESEKTLELRAFRAQGSSLVYFLQQRLIEKRIFYLKNKSPIPVAFENSSSLSLEVRMKKFYQYITETGLPFKDYAIWLTRPGEKDYYDKYLKSQNQTNCMASIATFFKINN